MVSFRTSVALAALMIAGPAAADDCADIMAFNDKLRNRLEMKELPCHCVAMSDRVDRVYKTEPPGMTCAFWQFYDKQCHKGLSCK